MSYLILFIRKPIFTGLLLFFSHFQLEMTFLETSALTGEGVEETFLKCGRAILTKIETGNCRYQRPYLREWPYTNWTAHSLHILSVTSY